MQPSSNSESASPALRLGVVVGLAAVAVVALATICYLWWWSDPARIDPRPLPRKGLNAPFITSPDAVVDAMVEVAELKTEDLVYDLGCGDGRIIISAALASGCHGVGFDIDPIRVAEARENVALHDVGELVTIEQQDVFKVDLAEADVVMLYLLPWMLKKLIPQIDQMPPGSRIVSHDFLIAGCKPDKTVTVELEIPGEGAPYYDRHYVHLWITPLKKNTAPE